MKMRMKRITGFFLSLVMVMGFLPLNPIVSYANDNASGDVKIDDKNFPDPTFRDYVSQNFDKSHHDGKLSQNELDDVKEIGINNTSVTSLQGIEYFKNLDYLDCSKNKITSLDVSKNINLCMLDCSINNLTSLKLGNNTNLRMLHCSGNQLTSLDLSGNTMPIPLSCNNQQYNITVIKGIGKFKYSDFPGRFDKDKVKSLVGATLGDDALIVNDDNPSVVTYKYNVGDRVNNEMNVKLNVTYAVVKIDDKHFPDENFRKFVKDNFDKNNNGYLSDDELDGVEELVLYWKQLSSLQGIEYFKNLKRLICFDSHITSLDVSRNPNLTKLICYDNDLKSLDVSHNLNLTELDCHNTQLKSLDVSHNHNLANLVCNGNALTSLDLSNNPNLTHLECTFSQLTSLDVSHNPVLTELQCNNNNLTSLNLNKNTKLTQLDCSNQRYDITVIKGIRKFEYSKFPRGFDKDKVDPDSLVGATLGDNALTVNSNNPSVVTYKYKVGDRNNQEMDVKLNVTFIEFDPTHVKGMRVTAQPSKLSYTADDKLALDGLVVTLTDDHNLTKDVTPAEFGTYGINADPANQTSLTVANNRKPVKLTKEGVPTAVTDKLTVSNQSSGSASGSLPIPSPILGGTGMNDDAPITVDKDELNIQIDSAESDSKPGNAGDGAGAAVKQAADMLDDFLAQAKHVETNPNATQAQVDADARKLADARKVQPETSDPKQQPETPDPKPQPKKRIGMISKKGESALFAVLLAVLLAVIGFSVAGLAFFVRRK